MFYSVWYNAPKSLLASGLESRGTDYVFGTKDVARLESSNILHTEHTVSASANNCPKHVELIGITINCHCYMWLVFYIIYINDAWSKKYQNHISYLCLTNVASEWDDGRLKPFLATASRYL